MSEYEDPRLVAKPAVTVADVRELMGASTPHFALQIRNRIELLIAPLPPASPARIEGELEIARLERVAIKGETRGTEALDGERPLPSLLEAEESR